MATGMPELGSKISLISKADIRYEGRLFTVDPQECTIALASVRSFGTEDRETQYPVAPQNQVYDYILFRGSDIKDIRVLNNVSTLPNDPAIMQLSVPPSLGPIGTAYQQPQFNHPIIGSAPFNPYPPMGGMPQTLRPGPLPKQPSELPQQPNVEIPPPQMLPPQSQSTQVKDQGSMLEIIGGGSRSETPLSSGVQRKSPTAEQGNQANNQNMNRQQKIGMGNQNKMNQQDRGDNKQMNRPRSRNKNQNQHEQQQQQQQNYNHNYKQGQQQGWGQRGGRGGRSGRGRGGFIGRPQGQQGIGGKPKSILKFENDYDFEQANTEFDKIKTQLAKVKISDGESQKPETEPEKKDDSGNETGAGEPEQEGDEGDSQPCYDKSKSFFDNISCEAVERSKGKSQRRDWRTERKLNSETFGISMTRRGGFRGRGGYWGGGGGGGNGGNNGGMQSGWRGQPWRGGGNRGNRGQFRQRQNQGQQQPPIPVPGT